MKRSFVIMLVLSGLVLGGIFGWKSFMAMQMGKAMASMALPPVTVATERAQLSQWVPTISAVGTLRAVQGVSVTAQIAGQINELHFESGGSVAAGELLLRQYIADDQARLVGLVADRELAESNFKRAEELIGKDLISDTDYDSARTELQRARAEEQNLRLIIEQKSIRAPFAGRLGIRQVDLGQYVEPGDPIVRLESLDQILVEFPVAQQQLAQLSVGQSLAIRADAWPGKTFSGSVRAIEPQVARDTRTVRVQGVMENPDEKLVPGMFVEVSVELPLGEQMVTVPQSAVTYSPYGDFVYVVEDAGTGKTVSSNFVVTGETRGDQVVIINGLDEGATIVTAGQQKLRNGSVIVIDNSVRVSNKSDPEPMNN